MNVLRLTVVIVAVLCTPSIMAAALEEQTLCRDNETAVFSCHIKESAKIASICVATGSDGTGTQNDVGYVQYRFGRRDKIELEFPANKQASKQRFYAMGSTGKAIAFVSGSYLYTVGELHHDAERVLGFTGIEVESRDEQKHTFLECAGDDPPHAADELSAVVRTETDFEDAQYYHYHHLSDDSLSSQQEQLCGKAVLDAVRKFNSMPNFTDYIASEACVPWPDAASHVMAAFAYDTGSAGDYGKDLIVVLVNTKKKEVVASYKGQIQEDGAMRVEADTLSFDLSSYGLVAPGIHLFALDKKSGYLANCGDGGSGSDRTFFVVDGKVIRVVLDQFITSSWYYTKGGSARCGASDEEVETENTYYSITVDKDTSNGFADLLFVAQPSSSIDPFHCKLHYDGKQYLLPDLDKDCKQKYNEWDALYRAKVRMRH